MRIALDTNVLVSGMLNASGPPGRIVDLVIAGLVIVLFDDRLLSEYRQVLYRPKFGLRAGDVDAVLGFVESTGEPVAAEPLSDKLDDPDDLPFLEIAVSGKAEALVTGNNRHFAKAASAYGVKEMTPAQFVAAWTG